jgi:hypothetical protein
VTEPGRHRAEPTRPPLWPPPMSMPQWPQRRPRSEASLDRDPWDETLGWHIFLMSFALFMGCAVAGLLWLAGR